MVLRLICVIFLSLITMTRCAKQQVGATNSRDQVKELRVLMLTHELPDAAGEKGQPFAIVMDVGSTSATVSVFAASTGDSSLYRSDGAALIGGIGVNAIRAAAMKMVREAASHKAQLSRTSEYPY